MEKKYEYIVTEYVHRHDPSSDNQSRSVDALQILLDEHGEEGWKLNHIYQVGINQENHGVFAVVLERKK